MKKFFLASAITVAASAFSYAQAPAPVIDTHPNATIYIYDPQSGQEMLATNDDAILFKDALVQLVANTAEARSISRSYGGHKTIVITQAAPEQGNVYQVEMHDLIFGRTSTIYTFSYNVDQNTLYYYDTNSQSWITEEIAQGNSGNLNDAYNYGKFNDPQSWVSNDDGTGDDVTVQASTPPPPLEEYDQPECPADGYLWQPGYWAYNNNGGYYWVRGVWVAPPTPGYLWTPPYWGYEGGIYLFHAGYWGVHVGFYGGINYGYGYGGRGFYGGVWEGNRFRYNTAVVRVNVNVVHNTYVDKTVIVNKTVVNNKRVSFNGQGGVDARPTPEEVKATNQPRVRDHSQDPKAPKPAPHPFVNGLKNNGGSNNPNGNVIKTPGKNMPANRQQNPAGNNEQQKTPSMNGNQQKNDGTIDNQQKPAATDNGQTNQGNKPWAKKIPGANGAQQNNPGVPANTPKVPGSDGGPGVPKGPGKVNGNGNGQNNQRQPNQQQRQNGNQNGGRQQQKNDKNPPPADKKNPNN